MNYYDPDYLTRSRGPRAVGLKKQALQHKISKLVWVEGEEYIFYKNHGDSEVRFHPVAGRDVVLDYLRGTNSAGPISGISDYGIVDLDYTWMLPEEKRPEHGIENVFILEENNHEMMLLRHDDHVKMACEMFSVTLEQFGFAIKCAEEVGSLRAGSQGEKLAQGFSMKRGKKQIGCEAFQCASTSLDVEIFNQELSREFKNGNPKISMNDFRKKVKQVSKRLPYQLIHGKDLMHFIAILVGEHKDCNCNVAINRIRTTQEKMMTQSEFKKLSIVATTSGHDFWK